MITEVNFPTRTLGNGEIWEKRYTRWHMVGINDEIGAKWGYDETSATWQGDYSPLDESHFESYAECFA